MAQSACRATYSSRSRTAAPGGWPCDRCAGAPGAPREGSEDRLSRRRSWPWGRTGGRARSGARPSERGRAGTGRPWNPHGRGLLQVTGLLVVEAAHAEFLQLVAVGRTAVGLDVAQKLTCQPNDRKVSMRWRTVTEPESRSGRGKTLSMKSTRGPVRLATRLERSWRRGAGAGGTPLGAGADATLPVAEGERAWPAAGCWPPRCSSGPAG